jgi:CheY-like chemotaxis protein
LEGLGYFPTAVTNSEKVLEMFRSDPEKFDLVITDMTMPRLMGDELAVALMTVRPDIPVILCTGCNNKSSEKPIKKIDIKALLYKPFIKTEFAGTIRRVLDTAYSDS